MTDVPLGRLGPVTGRAGDITVTLTDLSFLEMSTGRRYPYPEFGSDFIEALHRSLTGPEHRGLIRQTLRCPSCESPLDGIVVGPVQVATELAFQRIAPVRLDLNIPGITCPGCGQALVMIDDPSVDSDVSDALIDAFAAAAFGPG
jgi:hypothetical protein